MEEVTTHMEEAMKNMEHATQEQFIITNETTKQSMELSDLGVECEKDEEAVAQGMQSTIGAISRWSTTALSISCGMKEAAPNSCLPVPSVKSSAANLTTRKLMRNTQ